MISNRKTKIIILIIIILLIITYSVILKDKNSKKEENTVTPYEYVSDIETVKELEVEINDSIIDALSEVEEDYQSAVKNYSGYKRSDFYNESRINKAMSTGKISFVNVEDISVDELYNLEGGRIEELPEITFNGASVELETDSNITAGKYYLIRCESGQMYNYYYVMTISNTGKASIEWICYTENEITDNELLDEMESDLNE